MKKTTAVFILLAVGLGMATMLEAMPAFARKYQMSCKVCHSPFPKLKPYAEEFAANGFTLKDKEAPRYFADTGDEKVSLIRNLPFALRLEGYASLNNNHGKTLDLSTPYLIKLLSGGELFRNVSYYFYFFFSERGKVAGLEDAFIMFNELVGGLDVIIGQFQVSDPLFKSELRLSYEPYKIYKTKPGLSAIDLTYDRGVMLTYGLKGGTDLVLEVVNGCGIGESDANPGGNFDADKYKNVMGRVSQDVGDSLRIGAFGYIGKERGATGLVNSMWVAGADATWTSPHLELNLQYVERRDDNPSFLLGASEVATRGGFAELIYLPRGDDSPWYGAGLFNWVDSDLEELAYTAATLHGGWVLRRNFRLVAEATYAFESSSGKYPRFGIGLVTAF
ncbi:MAG: hypothetical protein PHX05_00640 [Acidobacteriota bacterium]|jgi:hypothetical protein|nr:hypothetical protein [Acidobacteriota bacterium]